MSSLGCVINFSRYLVLKLVISALNVGICRSVCRRVFGTYHGEQYCNAGNILKPFGLFYKVGNCL